MPSIKIEKLTRKTDFLIWAERLRAALSSEEDQLQRFLDRDPDPDDEAEIRMDAQARSKIVLSVDDTMISIVRNHRTAAEAFRALTRNHQGRIASNRQQAIADAAKLRQGSRQTVHEYAEAARKLYMRLNELHVPGSDTIMGVHFLGGIHDRFQAVIPHLNDNPQLEQDFEAMLERYTDLARSMWRATEELAVAHNSVGNKHRYRRPLPRRPRPQGAVKPEGGGEKLCYNCDRPGHFARNCPRPPRRDGPPHRGAQGGQPLDLPPAVLTVKAEERKEPAEGQVKLTLEAIKRPENMSLIFDSGATHHVVKNSELLFDIRQSSVDNIVLGGNERHSVVYEGDLLVTGSDTKQQTWLMGALYVPTLGWNLASGMQITERGGTCWQGQHCTIHDPDGNLRLTGQRLNGLYFLSCDFIVPEQQHDAQIHAAVSLELWHQRLGHAAVRTIERMEKENAVGGLEIAAGDRPGHCHACNQAKQHKVPHPANPARHSDRVCHRLHSDIFSVQEEGLNSKTYIMTIMDDYSRYAEVELLKYKSGVANAMIAAIRRFQRQTGNLVRILRTDGGKEYLGQLCTFLQTEGIVHEVTPPYTPEMNGRAERVNRVLKEWTRATLFHFQLPKYLWEYALQAAAYVRNLVLPVHGRKTPHEIFYGAQPTVSHLRVFGCKATVLKPQKPGQKRPAMDPVNETGIFVGYTHHTKAWKILLLRDDGLKVVESCNVIFFEDTTWPAVIQEMPDASPFPQHPDSEWDTVPINSRKRKSRSFISDTTTDTDELLGGSSSSERHVVPAAPAPAVAADVEMEYEEPNTQSTEPPAPDVVPEPDAAPAPAVAHAPDVVPEPDVEPDVAPASDVAPSAGVSSATHRRNPPRQRNPPVDPYLAYMNLATAPTGEPPATIQEAMDRPDWPLWRDAINAELRSCWEKGVFITIPKSDVPEGFKVLMSRMVFELKRDEHGNVIRYKARLVAKGFQQRPGIDFDSAYAPTVQTATLLYMLGVAAQDKMGIRQIDVKTAFLNADLQEEIYLRLPPALRMGDTVWRLRKALYGLRQAAKEWYQKWSDTLNELGFFAAKADPCLFLGNIDGQSVHIVLHVDDILLFGSNTAIDALVAEIGSRFDYTDEGFLTSAKVNRYLGMELTRSDDARLFGILLTQERFTRSLLEEHGMAACTPVAAPMEKGTKLYVTGVPYENVTQYASLVGSLLYLSTKTRPDIAYVVSQLARFMAAPTQDHMKAAKRVLRYLAADPGAGLQFKGRKLSRRRGDRNSAAAFDNHRLRVYADADFAGDQELARSTSGVVAMIGDSPISWTSKLQTLVALSTTEAEMIAAASGAREALWMRKIYSDVYGTAQQVTQFCDNQPTLNHLSCDQEKVNRRTKHIHVQYGFTRVHVMQGDIRLKYISTQDMIADVLTKPVTGDALRRLCEQMGMHFKKGIKGREVILVE